MNNRVLPVYFEEFEQLLHIARRLHEDKAEPIPLMSDDNVGKVKSCLAQPFQTFDGKYLYSGFIGKAVQSLA